MRSKFYDRWVELGAAGGGVEFFEYHAWELPLHFGNGPAEHLQVRALGGLFDASFYGVLRISGKDAKDFLDRMTTVNMKKMAVGKWQLGLLLTVQGKVLSMFRMLQMGSDEFLLFTQVGLAEQSLEHLEKYQVSEELGIVEETGEWSILGVHGPAVSALLSDQGFELNALAPDEFSVLQVGDADILAMPVDRMGEFGYEFAVGQDHADVLWDKLCTKDLLALCKPFGMDAENTLRFEAGFMDFGMEIDESIIPLEARLDEWVEQNQGCYLGQEVVERIRTTKNVPKLITGFLVDGTEFIAPGTPILTGNSGEQVGVIVNSMYGPTLNRILAVGYVKRKALESAAKLTIASAAASEAAGSTAGIEFVEWPFYQRPELGTQG